MHAFERENSHRRGAENKNELFSAPMTTYNTVAQQ